MTCIRKPTICHANAAIVAAAACILGCMTSAAAESICALTPQDAVSRYLGRAKAEQDAAGAGQGFRVWRTATDSQLKRRWVWVEACGASRSPAQLIWIPLIPEEKSRATASEVNPQASLVRVGDGVVVLESSTGFSMRLSGVALEAGEQGSRIHVRIPAWHSGEVLVGTVSGRDEIRLENETSSLTVKKLSSLPMVAAREDTP
jgi:Chaperone for flagella basal body P-ring formation